MDVVHRLRDLPAGFSGAAVAIGNFDGLHLGHSALLDAVKKSARRHQVPSCVLTFYPHPSDVLRGGTSAVERLMTTEEKLGALEAKGIDLAFVAAFDAQLSKMSAQEFFDHYLRQGLCARAIHVGADFRFGKGRQGDLSFLEEKCRAAGIELDPISPVLVDEQRVSSTWIRDLLRGGDVRGATRGLGRPYQLKGRVVHGDNRGAGLGFPTANLKVPGEKLIPASGVYACFATWQRQNYPAVLNIGIRPTFGGPPSRTIEVHLMDFAARIYDEDIVVHFVERLREEKRFDSVEDLVRQIQLDVKRARELLS